MRTIRHDGREEQRLLVRALITVGQGVVGPRDAPQRDDQQQDEAQRAPSDAGLARDPQELLVGVVDARVRPREVPLGGPPVGEERRLEAPETGPERGRVPPTSSAVPHQIERRTTFVGAVVDTNDASQSRAAGAQRQQEEDDGRRQDDAGRPRARGARASGRSRRSRSQSRAQTASPAAAASCAPRDCEITTSTSAHAVPIHSQHAARASRIAGANTRPARKTGANASPSALLLPSVDEIATSARSGRNEKRPA